MLSFYFKKLFCFHKKKHVYTDHIAYGIYRFLKCCSGVMTWIFSDDFTDGMTEGFKSGSPYSDVAQSPAGIPTVFYRELQKDYSILPQLPTDILTKCVPSVFYRDLQKNYSILPQSSTAIPMTFVPSVF
jgi:hypothetical protein